MNLYLFHGGPHWDYRPSAIASKLIISQQQGLPWIVFDADLHWIISNDQLNWTY